MNREIEFTESYKDHVFGKVFVSMEGVPSELPLDDPEDIITGCYEGVVCIASHVCSDTVVKISNALQDDKRQYLLFSEEKGVSSVLGNKYVRVTKTGQRGMVVINIVEGIPDVAWIFPSSESKMGYKITDKKQCEILYRSFCNLFWQCDGIEYRGSSNSSKAETAFGQEFQMSDRCCMNGAYADVISRYKEGTVYADDLDDVPAIFSEVYLRDGEKPERWVNDNYKLKLFERTHGFSMVVKGNDGYLLPSAPDNNAVNWSVRINKDQISELKDSYTPGWEYKENNEIKKTIGKSIRYLTSSKVSIPIEKKIKIEDDLRCSSIDEYLSDEDSRASYLTSVDNDHPVAESVEYKVTLHPPELPRGASEDNLYDSWNETIEQWKDALDILSNDGDKQIGTVPDGTERIGLLNTLSDLKIKIDELKSVDISVVGDTRLNASLKQYESLCDNFEDFRKSCDMAVQRKKFEDDRSREMRDINSNLESLAERRSDLERKLDGHEKIISKNTERSSELEKKIGAIGDEIKTLNQKIEDLRSKIKKEKKDKDKDKIQKDIDRYQGQKEDLQGQKRTMEGERDALVKEKREIESSKSALELNIRDTETKQAKLKEVSERVFEYRQNPLHIKNKLVPKKFSFPGEPLPRDRRFVLYSDKGTRYLTVPDEEKDEIFKDSALLKDAAFYNAKIVVR